MRRWLSFFALTLAFGMATWLGWWGVVVVGGLWGVLRPRVNAPAGTAACAAGLAWGGWLLYDHLAAGHELVHLMRRLEGVLALSGVAIVLLTLSFGMLLAWSVSALAGGVMDILSPRTGGTS